MTITRALNELKLLDKRIMKQIKSGEYTTYSVNGENKVKDFNPKAAIKSVEDLIERRAQIKAAIMASNAKTYVTVGDTKMLVIDAIEMKDSIKYKRAFLNELLSDYASTMETVEDINREVKRRLDGMLRESFGKSGEATQSEYDGIAKPFLKMNEAKGVNMEAVKELYDKLEAEVDTFENEVDFVLSESNAITVIDI